MAAYIKLFTDYVETFEELSDAEAGRLIKAVLRYGESGESENLQGSERLVYGIICRQIDRENATAEAHREAGRSGGRPKKAETKENQTEPNETKQNQIEPNETKIPDKDKDKDKEEDKEKDNDSISSCAESGKPSSAPAVIDLPLNDGSKRGITQEEVDHWKALYPAVDVMQELRKMVGWLEANPSRRKTKRGVGQFVTSWLSKAQDRGGSSGTGYVQKPTKTVVAQQYEQRDYSGESEAIPQWAIERAKQMGVSAG